MSFPSPKTKSILEFFINLSPAFTGFPLYDTSKTISFAKSGTYFNSPSTKPKALKAFVAWRNVLFFKSASLLILNKYEEALKYCNYALELEPENCDANGLKQLIKYKIAQK